MDVREIPHEGKRVETGVVQFGDDWPGIFIRGDRALYLAMALESALSGNPAPFMDRVAASLPRLLRSCNVHESAVHAPKIPQEETGRD